MKLIILLLALALAACNSVHSGANVERVVSSTPTPSPQLPGFNVRRITSTELEELIKQGNVVVVDVRNKEQYDLGHIKGAKLLPINEVGERGKELPRDKMIVTYCA